MINKIEKVEISFLNKFFQNHKNIDKTKLKITTEGIYSISGYKAGNYLCSLIKQYLKNNNITITDGTGNNGTDTISFGLNFNKVNSIENNDINYEVLKNNINVYQLTNVKLFKGSSLNIIPTIKQDVIFIDAPWTKNYKEKEIIKLFMDNIEISEIFNNLKNYTKLFIFKVPTNYDFNFFIKNTNTNTSNYSIFEYKNKNRIVFYYIFISI
jgi:16S rRNA G966 N2-methylase RsmD